MAIHRGFIERDTAGEILGNFINTPYLNLYKTLFQDEIIALLPFELAKKYQAIPIQQIDDTVTIACLHPEERVIQAALSRIVCKPVKLVLCLPDELNAAQALHYQLSSNVDDLILSFDFKKLNLLSPEKHVELHQIIEIADSLLLLALKENVSDVHIEPNEHDCIVRFRVDGVLFERLRLPVSLATPIAARYKIMANINITEHRVPQEGNIRYQTSVKPIDVRVSILPILHGEKVVLHLLDSLAQESVPMNLDKLHIQDENLRKFKEVLAKTNGLILVTGVSGTGKTTTLYAALNHINKSGINIVTIEDSVEYEIAAFNQVALNIKAGRDVATVLKSILNQDPDVLLIGDISDAETAKIACKTALTGHLVLSSVCANNALQAITHLTDMDIEAYLVAPALIGIFAQQLVRKLCEHCKTVHNLDDSFLQHYFFWENIELPTFYKAVGCKHCNNTGYKGRIGIQEFIKIDTTLRDYILQGRNYDDLSHYIYSIGFKDLRFDGFIKALQGLTSIEEVLRVTAVD